MHRTAERPDRLRDAIRDTNSQQPDRDAGRRQGRAIARLLEGYRSTCLLVAAVRLGVVDALAKGPCTSAELATALGLHGPSLHRFLRALAALELLDRTGDRFALSALGQRLLPGESGARALATLTADEYLPAWTQLEHAVRSGETAFDHAFGMSVWQHRREQPALGDAFARFMASGQTRTVRAVLDAFDFSKADLVVDVGGGHGGLLAGILARHPRARGIVFDQPQVVAQATASLEAAGLAARCRAVAGSFFESVPPEGDVYLLGRILHDWDDDACRRVLAACRAAMRPASALLIAESILPADDRLDDDLAMRDLHMMLVPGGRERTLAEYTSLLSAAGLELVRSTASDSGPHVLEARPSVTPSRA